MICLKRTESVDTALIDHIYSQYAKMNQKNNSTSCSSPPLQNSNDGNKCPSSELQVCADGTEPVGYLEVAAEEI
jgi:hypothetical protein